MWIAFFVECMKLKRSVIMWVILATAIMSGFDSLFWMWQTPIEPEFLLAICIPYIFLREYHDQTGEQLYMYPISSVWMYIAKLLTSFSVGLIVTGIISIKNGIHGYFEVSWIPYGMLFLLLLTPIFVLLTLFSKSYYVAVILQAFGGILLMYGIISVYNYYYKDVELRINPLIQLFFIATRTLEYSGCVISRILPDRSLLVH